MTNAKICSMTAGIIVATLLYATIVALCSCGFEKDDPADITNVTIQEDTKYKVLVLTPCSFRIEAHAIIPDDYAHYKKDLHQLTAIFGPNDKLKYTKGTFSTWDTLTVTIPCGACTMPLRGGVYLLDDRIDLIPWGCGRQRPPALITEVYAEYIDPGKNAKPIAEADQAEWSNEPPKKYTTTYSPRVESLKEICDDQPVLFDLQPACQVLVDAGVLGTAK